MQPWAAQVDDRVATARARTVLAQLRLERAALATLVARAPHLTRGELSQRLAALDARLRRLDEALQ